MNQHKYSDEHIAFLVNENTKCISYKELAEKFNNKFGTNVSADAIRTIIYRKNIKVEKRHLWTDENVEFIKNNAENLSYSELTEVFNDKFNTNLSEDAIKRSLHNQKSVVKKQHLWTDENLEFIKNNVESLSYSELTEVFNKKFNTDLSLDAIRTIIYRRNLKVEKRHSWTDEKAEFIKDNMESLSYSELTEVFNNTFDTNVSVAAIQQQACKMGIKKDRLDIMEIGHESVYSGKIMVKTQLEDGKTKWKYKHNHIWETHHKREIPKNHIVIFADGNDRNFDIDNLVLISRKQFGYMQNSGLLTKDSDLTKTGTIIAELMVKTNEKQTEMRKRKKSKKSRN